MEQYTAILFVKNRPEYLQNFLKSLFDIIFFFFFLLMSCTFRTKSEGKAQCNPLEAISTASSAQLSLAGYSL